MDYKNEYDEYWSRPDRWGSHSFRNPEIIADQIISVCGRGKILDVGFGMGLLVQTLLTCGLDARGMDVAERVVQAADQLAPGKFVVGSILAMPFVDEAFETVVSTDCLEHIAEADVSQALAELHRVTQRHLFIQLATTPDRDQRWHLTIHDRAWWEQRFFEAGFRKHPASQELLPYESLENEPWQITLLLEKIPRAARAQFPLASLKPERDLHMDMLRETGRRSDAHLARYMLARRYVPQAGGLVLDTACGLGYGSAILASGAPTARIVGMDASAFAIDYARANFSPQLLNLEFCEGDVCQLGNFADGSVDLVVSFETVEHLREPEVFLAEVKRVLKPGGVFIGSVPNLWVDETGRDPNPCHFHIFDFPKLAKLCRQYFTLSEVYRQTAGGGMKLPHATRQLRRVNLPVTSEADHAEWWVVIATQEKPLVCEIISPAAPGCLVLLTGDPNHPLYASWLPEWKLPWKAFDPACADFSLLKDAAMIVTHDTYFDPGRSLVREAVAAGIPTLILADGILEYRNTWEHPQISPGAIFQPVLGHKIACLGRSQARYLESWDNAGKCEVVGSPRLDRYYELQRRQKRSDEPFRLLVMTALTPYFTEGQHHQVRTALLDLKEFLGEQQTIGGFGIETVWRLTKGLDKEIGIASTRATMDFTGRELAEMLQAVDAVITTPSTGMLEAMLLGLPVAVLDYGNSPLYVQPAWRISAKAQLSEVLMELLHPPEPKMLFQDTTLHDALECATPAAPRLVATILEMMKCGHRARETGERLQFPRRILKSETDGYGLREDRFRLDRLYNIAPQIQGRPQMGAKNNFTSPLSVPVPLIPAFSSSGGEGARRADEGVVRKLIASLPEKAQTLQGLTNKGKILFISHDASRTGAPILLLNLIRGVRERKEWDVRILLRAGGPLEPQFQELGETFVCAGLELQNRWLEDVALIYSNTCTNGLFLKPLVPDAIPVITHIHEMQYAIEAFGAENFAEVKKHTSHFVACSEAVLEGLRQHHQIPAEKISVIYGGIPVQSVIEGASARTTREVRQWCGLGEDDFVIAACGFADWRKGPDLFVQLADAMRRQGRADKLSFLWIGKVPADQHGKILLHDVRQLGLSASVKFIGEQQNPFPFLNACDLFCLCSREDPFPLVMLEAAALRKPVVCFEQAGGANEFCARGGGLAAPYLNVEALGDCLFRLLENQELRREIGEAGARLVNEEFNLRCFAPRILQLIEKFNRPPKPKPIPKPPTFGERLKTFGKWLIGI